MAYQIRPMLDADWPAVSRIYQEGIDTNLATFQLGIMQDNSVSISLHENCGFRMVGYREKIGRDRFGAWRNTVLVEKRSDSDCFDSSCSCDSGKE